MAKLSQDEETFKLKATTDLCEKLCKISLETPN